VGSIKWRKLSPLPSMRPFPFPYDPCLEGKLSDPGRRSLPFPPPLFKGFDKMVRFWVGGVLETEFFSGFLSLKGGWSPFFLLVEGIGNCSPSLSLILGVMGPLFRFPIQFLFYMIKLSPSVRQVVIPSQNRRWFCLAGGPPVDSRQPSFATRIGSPLYGQPDLPNSPPRILVTWASLSAGLSLV